MNPRLAVLVVALLPVAAACSGLSGSTKLESRAERTDRIALDVKPGETLLLQTAFGGVKVRTVPGALPTLTVRFAVRARSTEEADEVLAAARMVVEREEGVLRAHPVGKEVTVERVHAGPLTIRPTADLEAVLPPGTVVRIEAGAGAIHADGPLGAVTAHASLGRVVVEGARGDVRVRAGSGDVEIVDVEAPHLELSSSYGNVDVDGVFLNVKVSAGQGSVRFTARPRSRVAGPWEISSGFGQIEVELPPDISARLVAAANLGAIRSALPLGGSMRRRQPPTLTGDLGSGGETITLTNGSGDITIRASR